MPAVPQKHLSILDMRGKTELAWKPLELYLLQFNEAVGLDELHIFVIKIGFEMKKGILT